MRLRVDPSSRMPVEPLTSPTPEAELDALRARARAGAGHFVELAARTSFSFLAGATAPEAMVRRAAELGMGTLAVTDRDGLYGIVRAHEAGKELGVRVVVGCELTLDDVPAQAPKTLLVLVESRAGYTNLCRILTESHARHPKGARPTSRAGAGARAGADDDDETPRNTFAGLPLERVLAHAEGLFALPEPGHPLGPLIDAFGERLALAATLHKDGRDRARLAAVLEAERTFGRPVVATNRPLFALPEERPVLDVLSCIREGTTLDEAGRLLLPNAEAHLKSDAAMRRVFSAHPAWVERAAHVAARATFAITDLAYRFPFELDDLDASHAGETADDALARLAWAGARQRLGERLGPPQRAQLEKELDVIRRLGVAPYFLSVRSVVEMARAREILCQGRGSAANSIVCFALGITAVDPSESDMLFERFLSVERNEPPDIDVDFEHERREEVIQEIYRKYGRERAAMVSEVISYRAKSAIRDVGKAFGLSLSQVESLSSILGYWDGLGTVTADRLEELGLSASDPRLALALAIARKIQGFPRHLSIHVGGFVLSAEPLCHVAPVEPATMEDRTIIPWDKDDIDTLGFFKVDVLGLGMLTALRKGLDLATATTGFGAGLAPNDKLAAIPREVPEVYDALCRADTVGVFQIESRAQMSMLPRLRPREYYDLVVEVAIVRPGPIQGGMVHPYLRRRNGEEPAVAPHPILEPILKRTKGVPLFQEQVMQIAIVGAGYTGGEADALRRDMAAWRKNGNLARHRDKLLAGFRARGIPEVFAEQLYAQIQGFGEYGFPESHAASFAKLVYASAWLKRFHPAAFAAALVNSQPMGFYSPSTLLKDAERHGVELRPLDVRASDWDCTLEGTPPAIRLGLRLVRGLGEKTGRALEAARTEGPFASLADLRERAGLGRDEVLALAEAGALDGLTGGRREALWDAAEPQAGELFAGRSGGSARPRLPKLGRGEQLALDYARTGVSLGDHPMALVRESGALPPRTLGSRELLSARHGARVSVAGLVICRQRPQTASGVVFLTLEDDHGFSNVVLWARVFEAYRRVATGASLLLVHGKVERGGPGQRGGPPLEGLAGAAPGDAPASTVYVVAERLEAVRAPRGTRQTLAGVSRDFR